MNPVASIDWPTIYLYNGFLMDEDGDCLGGQPKAFSTLQEAEDWLSDNDIRGSVVRGVRKGDRLYPKES